MRVARSLAERLRPATGYRLPVSATRRKPVAGDVVLALAPGDRSLGDEGYRLRVEPGLVRLDARTAAGLFHGCADAASALARLDRGAAAAAGAVGDRRRHDPRQAPLRLARR